jgi:hypothetical protein
MAGILDLALQYQPQLLAAMQGANPYPTSVEGANEMASQFMAPDMVGPEMRARLAEESARDKKDYRRGKWLALAKAGFGMADKGFAGGAQMGLEELNSVIKDRKASRDQELQRQLQMLMMDQGRANAKSAMSAGFYGKGLDAKASNVANALNTGINVASKQSDDNRQGYLAGLEGKKAAFAMRTPEQLYEEYRKVMSPEDAMAMLTGGNNQKTAMMYTIKGRMNSLESLMAKNNGDLTEEQQAEYEALSKQLGALMGLGAGGAPAPAAGGLADIPGATTAKGGKTSGAKATAADPGLSTRMTAARMIGASGSAQAAIDRLNATPDSDISPGEKRVLTKAIRDHSKMTGDVAKANGYK